MFNRRPRAWVIILLSVIGLSTISAGILVLQSASFEIPRSAVSGGGNEENSASFFMSNTVAQSGAVGYSESSDGSFRLDAGYQQPKFLILWAQNIGVSSSPFNPYLDEVATFSYVLTNHCREVTITVDGVTLVDKEVQRAGLHSTKWDGRNAVGALFDLGTYTFTLAATSFDGQQTTRTTEVMIVDDIPLIVNVEDDPDPFHPFPEGYNETTTISFSTEAPIGITVLDKHISLANGSGLPVTDILIADEPVGYHTQEWDGTDAPDFAGDGNPSLDGIYQYVIGAISMSPSEKSANQRTGTISLIRRNTVSEYGRNATGDIMKTDPNNPSSDPVLEVHYDALTTWLSIQEAQGDQVKYAAWVIRDSWPPQYAISKVFQMEANPTTLAVPAILIFRYDREIEGRVEDKVQIKRYNEALKEWEVLENQYIDYANNLIVAEILQPTSIFAVFTGLDTTAPAITITSPESKEYYNFIDWESNIIDLTYSVEDPTVDGISSGVREVEVFLNGEPYEENTIDLTDLLGNNTLLIKSWDKSGNFSRKYVFFTVLLESRVTLKPETLKVNPGVLTVFVEFPAGYDVATIQDPTCDGASAERMSLNGDGTQMIVKFRRQDIEDALAQKGETIDNHFVVRGTFEHDGDVYIFQGEDDIKKVLEGAVPR